MKNITRLFICICGCLAYTGLTDRLTVGLAFAHDEIDANAPISQNALISITNSGISPNTIHFKKKDGLLFFLNKTDDALITLKVNFGQHKMHCASSTMELGKDGFMVSKEPFTPKNFVTMCFPEIGRYEFSVYGIPKKSQGVQGTIIVE